ncbi:Lipopolysaccharide kinase [Penicillium hordei]|uniref:Lipopolysaccharide kinase n=1 Tax=Penicillium hordei TaxID=40994 RepID=A0AAD6H3H6_9EURO|nr:Lipopolysaccharide kinase [Penicillium hordei]KAJ5602832.1 Lipopolysaccharide kinase [Penicillium hordei]
MEYTNTPMQDQRSITLLQAEADNDDESYFRLLINGSVRYITIAQGIWSTDDMCFGPSLATILPDLPTGDWNNGLVNKHPETGEPYFARATRTSFPGVENTWHNTFVDYMDLGEIRRLRTGVYEVKCPQFEELVVVKFARFDWEIGYMEGETAGYQSIEGCEIGPRFLGHLTEDGRVIGFLMERIANARHAGPQDLDICQGTLARLHALGIKHGDVNRFNFLIRDSRAILIDFDTARKCDDSNLLAEELRSLQEALESSSTKGGGGYLC